MKSIAIGSAAFVLSLFAAEAASAQGVGGGGYYRPAPAVSGHYASPVGYGGRLSVGYSTVPVLVQFAPAPVVVPCYRPIYPYSVGYYGYPPHYHHHYHHDGHHGHPGR